MRKIKIDDFIMGHNISLATGGTNDLENIFAICAPCNSEMGKKSI